MSISETTKGDLAILAQSFLTAFFPIVAVISYKSISPLVALFFSTVFTTVFFLVLFIIKGKWLDLFKKGVIIELFLVALLIGVGYYGLYFFGLKTTSAGNASLISLMEIFFSYLFFNIWKQEPFDAKHILGSVLMLLGATLVLFNRTSTLKLGDLLVLIATMLPPLGNYYQQKLRKRISSQAILFGRSFLTLPFLAILALLFKENLAWENIQSSLWFFVLNGVVFLGISKIFWLEGIHRISVTKANVVSSVYPAFTLLLAALFLRQYPTIWQLIAFVPLMLGLVLLTYQKTASLNESGMM